MKSPEKMRTSLGQKGVFLELAWAEETYESSSTHSWMSGTQDRKGLTPRHTRLLLFAVLLVLLPDLFFHDLTLWSNQNWLDSQTLLNTGYIVHDFAGMCRNSLHHNSKTVFVDMGASFSYHNTTETFHNNLTSALQLLKLPLITFTVSRSLPNSPNKYTSRFPTSSSTPTTGSTWVWKRIRILTKILLGSYPGTLPGKNNAMAFKLY